MSPLLLVALALGLASAYPNPYPYTQLPYVHDHAGGYVVPYALEYSPLQKAAEPEDLSEEFLRKIFVKIISLIGAAVDLYTTVSNRPKSFPVVGFEGGPKYAAGDEALLPPGLRELFVQKKAPVEGLADLVGAAARLYQRTSRNRPQVFPVAGNGGLLDYDPLAWSLGRELAPILMHTLEANPTTLPDTLSHRVRHPASTVIPAVVVGDEREEFKTGAEVPVFSTGA